ncbi:putative glycoside hydrolase [Tuanshanicoccus lijuaniae]|uniref:putative glycoside hydrolase n=1 Tax=Aerococcaceae bacterium zg-1292 TaxID=2774330 RepID=UPI001BD86172|nr:putative glycoside hydrolase [Aerococcaceae bacterium zg-BR9]MBF6977835.1 putative glycoside hydrolase [Aerococcaceae bacterium zg-BR22]MBS4455956.1 putative glycoside hydrolase [Aerococcaceae bacterium zg-A91]MBS4457708.1 putative glycoside hydrolase [Aerococcaceae bacterium zg-BR33]
MKKQAISLSLVTLLLSACTFSQKPTEEKPTFTSMPKVESKYDQETLNEFDSRRKKGKANRYEGLTILKGNLLNRPDNLPKSLFFDSGINVEYPKEGVKGIYLNSDSVADTNTFNSLLKKVDDTALNAMVLDFKDDYGNIIPALNTTNDLIKKASLGWIDYPSILKTLAEHKIYPIARIVTFKDTVLAKNKPDYAFKTKDGEVWSPNGESFVNPFLKEVWDYNIDIAIEAAKMGFKEIQFDYIRFSDAFVQSESELTYKKGTFENYVSENPDDAGEERVAAITQFLTYARERLAPYGVNVSADIFGYTAVANNSPDVRGIGQHFASMAENVDVISSMIYPSHWGASFFGIEYPNTHPYEVVDEYMHSEKQVLSNVSNKVTSRPWLQDFTDSAAAGPYYEYNTEQVQAQINALASHGIHEFLLWNAAGEYSEGVDYAPEKAAPAQQ